MKIRLNDQSRQTYNSYLQDNKKGHIMNQGNGGGGDIITQEGILKQNSKSEATEEHNKSKT